MTRSKYEKSERIDVRVVFTQTRLKGIGARAYTRILRELFSRWLDGEPLPEGFELRVSWRNPDNRNPQHADWKYINDPGADEGEIDAARVTLNRGGWLSAAADTLPFTRSVEERAIDERTFDDLARLWRSGAISRRARREGKDPKRVYAGLKSARTRNLRGADDDV